MALDLKLPIREKMTMEHRDDPVPGQSLVGLVVSVAIF